MEYLTNEDTTKLSEYEFSKFDETIANRNEFITRIVRHSYNNNSTYICSPKKNKRGEALLKFSKDFHGNHIPASYETDLPKIYKKLFLSDEPVKIWILYAERKPIFFIDHDVAVRFTIDYLQNKYSAASEEDLRQRAYMALTEHEVIEEY